MKEAVDKPLIVGFVADVMFSVKIEAAADRLSFRVKWVESAGQVGPVGSIVTRQQPAEHLQGPGAVLIQKIVEWHPALLIFDLNNSQIPWQEWISLLTSVPATRRIPVICYGSHVDTEALQKAGAAGAKAVLARSRFVSTLPELILKYARIVDEAELAAACQTELSALALQGLEEFNRGEYFEAHESLEHAWIADQTPGRELYRAILQVAVAYLQIERRNYNGALKMFLRVRQWIEPLPPVCRGVNVDQLRRDAFAARDSLLALGAERIDQFDRRLFKPVQYQVHHS